MAAAAPSSSFSAMTVGSSGSTHSVPAEDTSAESSSESTAALRLSESKFQMFFFFKINMSNQSTLMLDPMGCRAT